MRYTLSLEGDRAPQRFELAYASILLGDALRNGNATPTLAEARTFGKLLDALEAISVEDPTETRTATGDPQRTLALPMVQPALVLPAPQYELARTLIERAVPHYLARLKRQALDALDWWLGATQAEE